MNEIYLTERQDEIYDDVIDNIVSDGRCLLDSTMGSGKSYITGKYINDYVNTKALILVPNKDLGEQWILKGNKFKMDIITYHSFKPSFIDSLDGSEYDVLICDEAHHTGAKVWGFNIQYFIEKFPQIPVIGLSATPNRLDKVDIINEIFNDNRIQGISFIEALETGLYPDIEYYLSSFNTDDLTEYEREQCYKINDEEVLSLVKRLDIENSKYNYTSLVGNICKKHKKIAVFCKNIAELVEIKAMTEEIFPDANHLSYNYKLSPTNRIKNLNKFKNSTKMSFIYTVDMFGEGFHVCPIDAVICVRKTVSERVYFQQIGRVLDTSGQLDKVTVIDFVSNIYNINLDKAFMRTGINDRDFTIINYGSGNGKIKGSQVVIHNYNCDKKHIIQLLKDKINNPVYLQSPYKERLESSYYKSMTEAANDMGLAPNTIRDAYKKHPEWGFSNYRKYLQSPYRERLESGYYDSMGVAAKDMGMNVSFIRSIRKKHPEWKFGTDDESKYLQSPYKERLESGYYDTIKSAAKDMGMNASFIGDIRKKHPEWKFGTDDRSKYLQPPYKGRLESGYYESIKEAANDMGMNASFIANIRKKHPEWKFGTDTKYLQSPYKERLESGYYESIKEAANDMGLAPNTIRVARKKHPEWRFGNDEEPKYLQSPYKERLESGYYDSMGVAAKDIGMYACSIASARKKHPEWKFGNDDKK